MITEGETEAQVGTNRAATPNPPDPSASAPTEQPPQSGSPGDCPYPIAMFTLFPYGSAPQEGSCTMGQGDTKGTTADMGGRMGELGQGQGVE